MTYQWRKGGVNLANGGNISGATSATLSLASTAAADTGSYDVVVSGTCSPAAVSNAAVLTVNTPPSVTTHPVAQTVCTGASASLSVVATGTGLSYQWRKNGAPMTGFTAPSFTLSSVAVTDAGSYDCVITGTCSPSLISNPASLTVNTPPSISVQPENVTTCEGNSATFSVTASGTALTYQWRKNAVNIAGATSSTYTIPSVAAADAGSYDVVISGTCTPAATSNAATLSVTGNPPSISAHPTSQAVCVAGAVSFSVTASGTALSYQWRKDGAIISGAISSTYSIASATSADAGSYDVVVSGACTPSVISSPAILTLNSAPVVTVQPATQSVCSGATVNLTVTATGAGLTYQWKKGGVNLSNGGNISGVTSTTLTISPATASDSGSYTVVVSGTCTPAATSNAANLTVTDTLGAAGSISGLTTVCEAQTGVTYSIGAVSGASTYAWTVPAGSAITAGQGTTSITVTWGAASGNVSVQPSNNCQTGATVSLAVTVNALPAVTAQPAPQTVCAGAPATFSVTATGPGLTYQWRKDSVNLTNGANISGATSATLSLSAAAPSDAGSYDVVVSGTCSPPAISNTAALVVNTPPAVTVQPVPRTVCAGTPVSFSVAATGASLSYQWRKDGVPLAGFTSSSFNILSVATTDAGSYDCVITGTCSPSVVSNPASLTVSSQPTITTQPLDTTKCAGESVTFSVVSGDAGLTYQWRKDGIDISGATLSTYTIAAISASDAGSYDVVLTSSSCSSSTTSQAAALTVAQAPSITTSPAAQSVCLGASATFSVVASGGGLQFQWRKNGVNLTNGGAVSGATSASLTLNPVSASHAGSYEVVVSNGCGPAVTSTAAALAVDTAAAITTQPSNQLVCDGRVLVLSVAATGSNLAYQWRKDGNNLAADARFVGINTAELRIISAEASDAGSYDVVVSNGCTPSLASTAASVTIGEAPEITAQPSGANPCPGSSATFTVEATGSGLTYVWRKNGAPISGATSASYTINSVSASDAGAYSVVVIASCGTAVTSSNASLAVKSSASISRQPASLTGCPGSSASFSVTATGSGLTYQWRKDGNAISGATSSSYNIASASASDAGSYDVVVTGECGTPVTSAARTLSLNAVSAITLQPASQQVCLRGEANFSVAATGTGLKYQWRINGRNLTDGREVNGSKTTALKLRPLKAENTTIDCVITGACGEPVTSAQATLTVIEPPKISQQPAASQTICLGETAVFTAAATGTGLTYRWQRNGADLSDDGNISGSNGSTLTILATDLAHIGSYRVVVTGSTCTTTATSASSALKLITPAGPAGTIKGPSVVCAEKTGLAFSIAKVNQATSYQWIVPDGATITKGQGTTSILVEWGTTSGEVKVTPSNSCTSGTPSTLNVTVSTLEITVQPANQTVLENCNLNVTFSAAATGNPAPKIQWQESRDGGTKWISLKGKTATTLTLSSPKPAQNGYLYRAVFSNGCSALASESATLTVNTLATSSEVTTSVSQVSKNGKVDLEATLSPASSCSLTPVKSVTFFIGTRKLGARTLANAGGELKATLTGAVIREAPGTYTIKAVFAGVNTYFQVSQPTTSLQVVP